MILLAYYDVDYTASESAMIHANDWPAEWWVIRAGEEKRSSSALAQKEPQRHKLGCATTTGPPGGTTLLLWMRQPGRPVAGWGS